MSSLGRLGDASSLLEHVRDVLLLVEREDGRIVDANSAAIALYGHARDELLSRTIFDLRATDPGVAREQMVEADCGDGTLFEALHVRKDGRQILVEVSSRGATLDGRRLLLSVVRDITERKRLEAERAALVETTQRVLETRDEFLVIASHELRAPITNVDLQLLRLQRSLARTNTATELAASIELARGEVARLASLIGTLLDAQRKIGTIVLARSAVDLAALLHEVSDRLRARSPETVVTFDVEDIVGTWDRMRLDQVFANLLTNAYKYGRGRPIRVCARREAELVHVEVRDEGIGIAREDLGRVFERYERAVPQAYGGLGLGLYIARQIVEAHEGRISVESELAVGSAFRVSLPLGRNPR